MPTKMSQAEFISQLKQRAPELKDFPDHEIMKKILERRPEVSQQVETPDEQAAVAQVKAEKRSRSLVDPAIWEEHPNVAKFTKSVLDVLPGAGAIAGGLLATPETLGLGTVAGGALGAGAGRGLRDVMTQGMGLEDTSPLTKAKNIGVDTALTAVIPGMMTAAKHPIDAVRMGAGSLANFERAIIPRGLRRYVVPSLLDDIAQSGKSAVEPILQRPSWQLPSNWEPSTPNLEKIVSGTSTAFKPGSSISGKPVPTILNVTERPRLDIPSSTGTRVGATPPLNEPVPNILNVPNRPVGLNVPPSSSTVMASDLPLPGKIPTTIQSRPGIGIPQSQPTSMTPGAPIPTEPFPIKTTTGLGPSKPPVIPKSSGTSMTPGSPITKEPIPTTITVKAKGVGPTEKVKLSADKAAVYMRLRKLGKSDKQIMEAIQTMEDLAKRLGTTTKTKK